MEPRAVRWDEVRDRMSEEGIFSAFRARLDAKDHEAARTATALLMIVAWIGFVAISGAHLGQAWGEPILGHVPRKVLYWVAVVLLSCATLMMARSGRRERALLAAMLLAYLFGNYLSGVLHLALDPRGQVESVWIGFVSSRLLYAFGVTLPMFVVYYAFFRPAEEFGLRLGRWSRPTRLAKADRPRSWGRTLAGFAATVAVPGFFVLQALVGFAPLTSGRLVVFFVPIVLMALCNALAEELIFRGLIHGASVRAAGPVFGIWAVGILFGIHHWGASFTAVGSLPISLAVGVGSVYFAKSVIETRGLAWAICAHALIDVCLYSAYYVSPD